MQDTDSDRPRANKIPKRHSAKSNFGAGKVPRTVGALAYGFSLFISTSVSANAGDVSTFPMKGVDLAAYRTYRLLPPKVLTKTGLHEDEPTIGPLIREALARELVGKGLIALAEGADLEVPSAATAVSILQVEALIYSWIGGGTSNIGPAPLAILGRYNKEGTLYVNLIDPRTNRSVWLGISTRALGNPNNFENDINQAAQALFKKYPPIK